MSFVVRVTAMLVWGLISLGALIAQPWLNIGNWEAIVFPPITTFIGLCVIWAIRAAFVARLLILAGYCAVIGCFHLAIINYVYVQKSDFIHELDWYEYYQAFIFFGVLVFIIACVVLVIEQVFSSHGRPWFGRVRSMDG